jgi:cytochrome c oxidase assembly protein subunit 15
VRGPLGGERPRSVAFGTVTSRFQLSPAAYRRITLAAAVSLAVIIVSGAGVRLTGSGLGCPDWPTCYHQQFHAHLRFHPMVEFSNRLFTGIVSIAVIAAVLGSLIRAPRRRDLTWWSLGLVAGVIGQIVLGGVTVLTHLTPPVVAGHFLLSMVLLWNAVVLHLKAGRPDGAERAPAPAPGPIARLAAGLTALAGAVLVTGTVVTGTGPNGGDEHVKRLDLSLTWMARIHSTTVWLLAATTIVLWVAARRAHHVALQRRVETLLWCIGAQGAIGYLQYAAGVPAGLVALHIAGATAVWTAAVLVVIAARGEEANTAVHGIEPVVAEGEPTRA